MKEMLKIMSLILVITSVSYASDIKNIKRNPKINHGSISILKAQKSDIRLDVFIPMGGGTAYAMGGILGVGIAQSEAEKDFLSYYESSIDELNEFDFDGYVLKKLSQDISAKGMFTAEKDNSFETSITEALEPHIQLNRLKSFAKSSQKSLAKVKNNLVLFYAITKVAHGNAQVGADAQYIAAFVLVEKTDSKNPVWAKAFRMNSNAIPTTKASDFKNTMKKLLDDVLNRAVADLHK